MFTMSAFTLFLLITLGLLAFPRLNVLIASPHLTLAGVTFIITIVCYIFGW
jgi:hypothetical protein